MLFKYKYVNHEIEKFQIYCDFLFLEVWVKARGPFDAIKLDRCPELKNIYELLRAVYEDSKDERYVICPLLESEANSFPARTQGH